MDTDEKIVFLKYSLPELLSTLSAEQTGGWGKMNAQQMIEHYTNAVKISSGVVTFSTTLNHEAIEKNHRFLMTDRPFKESIKDPLLPEEPVAFEKGSITEAIATLQNAFNHFFEYYQNNPDERVNNPIFGPLNFEEQVHLLHKHALHHLAQFGLEAV
jgi:hypothetical protein